MSRRVTTVCIPSTLYARELQGLSAHYFRDHELLKTLPNYYGFREIVNALITEYVDRRSLWVKVPSDALVTVERILPWFDPGLKDNVSADYYDHVIGHLTPQIDQMLGHILGRKASYDIWHVQTVGSPETFLTYGGDYRIAEWHQNNPNAVRV